MSLAQRLQRPFRSLSEAARSATETKRGSLRSLNGRGALRSHSGRGLLTRQPIEVVVVDTGTA